MKKIIIPIFLFAFLFNSCDVLDKQPLDIISDAVVWGDEVLADQYLVQCYSEMKFFFEQPYTAEQTSNTIMRTRLQRAVTISDEAMLRFPTNATFSKKSKDITISGGILEWWGYATVRKLNIFIEKMEASEFGDDYKTQRLAEARFLRAYAYFNMVKRYGGVPLITNAQNLDDTDEELYRSRDKEADIYDFILSELDAITDDLPETNSSNDLGRPTRYAVLAFKSRAAMYAASIATWGTVQLDGIVGISSDKANAYWQASYNASKEIIESDIFSLYNQYPDDKAQNFRSLFLDENNSEVIFSQIFDGPSGIGSMWDFIQVPHKFQVWGGGQFSVLYLQMVESFGNTDGTSCDIREKIASGESYTMDELFGNTDPRFKASVYTNGTSWTYKTGPITLDYHNGILIPDGSVITTGSYKGVLYVGNCYNNGQASPFGILKYLDEEERALVQETKNGTDTDYIVFRLGEIYLNLAEAAFELGKEGESLSAVNMIRERAGMPQLTGITRDLIRNERKIELAFEGNRYFDVRRWRTAVDDLTGDFQSLRFILDGDSFEEGPYDVNTAKFKLELLDHIHGTVDPYFVDKHYYLPITTDRTDNNPNLVENPGYQ